MALVMSVMDGRVEIKEESDQRIQYNRRIKIIKLFLKQA
jgi:hypothetical protein